MVVVAFLVEVGDAFLVLVACLVLVAFLVDVALVGHFVADSVFVQGFVDHFVVVLVVLMVVEAETV